MISVIMPTLNNGPTLAPALAALIPAAVQGIVREVIIVDAGSTDQTLKIADGCGAITLDHAAPPSNQCLAAAQSAKFPWVLLLSPVVVLDVGWEREVDQFIHRVETQKITTQAAVFPLVLDTPEWNARLAERLIRLSATLSGRPHPNQGLLIQRAQFIALATTTSPTSALGTPSSMPRCMTLRASAALDTSIFAARGPMAWTLSQFSAQRSNGWFSAAGQRSAAPSARQQPAIT
jgi:hypothetical protein